METIFPLPGFICDTGADGAPEFHIKARSSRVGVNFAWNDANPKWSISGKVEMDFEGNFNRSDNRNISSIRSNNPSLRLGVGADGLFAESEEHVLRSVRTGLDAFRLVDNSEHC